MPTQTAQDPELPLGLFPEDFTLDAYGRPFHICYRHEDGNEETFAVSGEQFAAVARANKIDPLTLRKMTTALAPEPGSPNATDPSPALESERELRARAEQLLEAEQRNADLAEQLATLQAQVVALQTVQTAGQAAEKPADKAVDKKAGDGAKGGGA